jgi:hypothetical protein
MLGNLEIGVRIPEQYIFLFSTASTPALVLTQPQIKWPKGAHSTGLKWLGRDTDHYIVPKIRMLVNALLLPHTS